MILVMVRDMIDPTPPTGGTQTYVFKPREFLSRTGDRRRVGAMRYFLLKIAVVMGQSVLAADKKLLITDPDLEKAIRSKYSLNKPKGKLTKLKRLIGLYLSNTKITDAA